MPSAVRAEIGTQPGTDRRTRDRRSALLRYLAVAALVRAADGGAAIGLLSLAVTLTGRPGGGAGVGGLLAALLTAPHLLGPVLARPLDTARDDRRVLAAAFATFGIALTAGSLLLGRTPVVAPAGCILLAGLCGPLMTGGLSAKLTSVTSSDVRAQRRAEGWDSATYGLGATLGPAAVAGLAALASPLFALGVLGAAALLGAALVLTLPVARRADSAPTVLSVRAALLTIATVGPLRRIMVATMLTALGTGGLMVIAVVLGGQLRHGAGSGAALGAAYGVGTLLGSLGAAAVPFRGEPERHAIRLVAVSAVVIGACALAPNYVAALALFTAAGAAGAMLFTASLAVRSVYSPDGARAQIFVSMAGLKMAMASVGTALAGVLVTHGPRPLLGAAAGVVAAAALIAHADRRKAHR